MGTCYTESTELQNRDRMYKMQENLENTGLQLPVDKVQGPVGGFVKSVFANLKPSKPGGDVNDNC